MRHAKASLRGAEWVGTSIRMSTHYLKRSYNDPNPDPEVTVPNADADSEYTIVKGTQSALATGVVAQYCPGIDLM